MIKESLEKKVNKLDGDIEALRRAKYYLSNKEEINEIIDVLNKERQIYSDEIYLGDGKAYTECLEAILELVNKELGKDEQIELLEVIKEQHGRKSPNISKKSYGLNAWLKFLDVECQWIDNEGSEWSTLIITGFTPRIQN
ncbi:hypothetical protein [Clostridium aciditolerans]|uniref:Uncharacterized protein n=1 Tax=Clostridium aciditolerans TaxID=339861 RepID=A0A934HZA1_9CLOT|nr:hypothetical protein [Clostridium aciditolerans]MBI6873257.1 hypothetical protein [Clostridium aciditolerans]